MYLRSKRVLSSRYVWFVLGLQSILAFPKFWVHLCLPKVCHKRRLSLLSKSGMLFLIGYIPKVQVRVEIGSRCLCQSLDQIAKTVHPHVGQPNQFRGSLSRFHQSKRTTYNLHLSCGETKIKMKCSSHRSGATPERARGTRALPESQRDSNPSAQGWRSAPAGEERGIHAASPRANLHAQKFSNTLFNPSVEAT